MPSQTMWSSFPHVKKPQTMGVCTIQMAGTAEDSQCCPMDRDITEKVLKKMALTKGMLHSLKSTGQTIGVCTVPQLHQTGGTQCSHKSNQSNNVRTIVFRSNNK